MPRAGITAPEVYWRPMKDHQAHCRFLPSIDITTSPMVVSKTPLWRLIADFVGLSPRSHEAAYIGMHPTQRAWTEGVDLVMNTRA